jgi:hypothetical protein
MKTSTFFVALVPPQPTWAQANETWLVPGAATDDPQQCRFEMTSGVAFPEPGSSRAPERVREAKLVHAGGEQLLSPVAEPTAHAI